MREKKKREKVIVSYGFMICFGKEPVKRKKENKKREQKEKREKRKGQNGNEEKKRRILSSCDYALCMFV